MTCRRQYEATSSFWQSTTWNNKKFCVVCNMSLYIGLVVKSRTIISHKKSTIAGYLKLLISQSIHLFIPTNSLLYPPIYTYK